MVVGGLAVSLTVPAAVSFAVAHARDGAGHGLDGLTIWAELVLILINFAVYA